MKISEQMIYNGGREIEATVFSPEKPLCAIQLLHGMAEHKERYTEMMTWLAMNDCMWSCMTTAVMAGVPETKATSTTSIC